MRPLLSRRTLLTGAAAGAAALAAPRRARASAVAPADRRFLFVYAMGGWDMTRVFAPLFDYSETIDMERDAALTTAGNIPYVDHPARPSVRSFFENYNDRVAIVNGFYISSISHSSASRMVTTGTPDASQADWGSRLAAWRSDKHVLPYLVIGGPNFAGRYGVHVGHAGTTGQLQGLATGDILAYNDAGSALPAVGDDARVDAYLQAVAARRAASQIGDVSRGYQESYGIALEKAMRIKDLTSTIDLDRGEVFGDQVALAARVLSAGISRCVAVAHPRPEVNVLWDSHANNDAEQSQLFEDFFAEMSALMEVLATTPGSEADTLLDETTVVCLSEMGRTPQINGSNGKDHWPYGTAMLFGAGVRGGQVIGGFDEFQFGLDVVPSTGETSEKGSSIGPNVLGATLMMMGDVDPLDEGLVDTPLTALIED